MNSYVTCHSDSRYDEKPISFRWEGEEYTIGHIQAEWRTPEGHSFQVMTVERIIFQLEYEENTDTWYIKPKN